MSRVRRFYRTHERGIKKIIENPIVIGAIAGVIENIAKGKQAIDVEKIKTQITQPNLSNPLLILGAGLFLRNKALQAIGAFLVIDPPEELQKETSPDVKISYKYISPKPPIIVKTVQ